MLLMTKISSSVNQSPVSWFSHLKNRTVTTSDSFRADNVTIKLDIKTLEKLE